ncbi:hypothetical protein [Aliamphritea spongicola]|nr:hypothetical protein [Aliamphritea spongicola]
MLATDETLYVWATKVTSAHISIISLLNLFSIRDSIRHISHTGEFMNQSVTETDTDFTR